VDTNEIFASLKGGGALQLVMGSAAEEKVNGWSEDEADSLLSLVGGWRLDEFANGVNVNGHITTNGTIPNGGMAITNNGVPNGCVPCNNVTSCVIHAMPHVCWCEVCSKGLCRVCSQVLFGNYFLFGNVILI
jgi:hypothetical protein